MKAISTPTLASGGQLSKLTLTGPESISPMPDRPASRQKGRWQQGVPIDLGGKWRRNRDNHPAGTDLPQVTGNRDVVGGLLDPAHGRVQCDDAAELGGQPQRDQL
jgi:hypothetical protein